MLQLKDNNGKILPKKVQDRVNKFIDNLSNISWFDPSKDIKKKDVDKQVNFILECFGVKAGIEYRKLEKRKDYADAKDSTWVSAMDRVWDDAVDNAKDKAWDSAMAIVRDSALDSALDSAVDGAVDGAVDSAWTSFEILLQDNKDYNKKYPNGAFKQLFKLWEMGLYPVGVLKNGNFVIYADSKAKDLFKEETNNS